MRKILVSTGEPAGIGPDICLENLIQAANSNFAEQVIFVGDADMLQQRAELLGLTHDIRKIAPTIHSLTEVTPKHKSYIWHHCCKHSVQAGKLNAHNSEYIIGILLNCVNAIQQKQADALVTAPAHKAIINQQFKHIKNQPKYASQLKNIPQFLGHTEFLQQLAGVEKVVMMLACDTLKVALVTTHIPISQVSQQLTQQEISATCHITAQSLHNSFKNDWIRKRPKPHIAVLGLNPHAGEDGHIGIEEIEIIQPAISNLPNLNCQISGNISADTAFTKDNLNKYDCFIAMYHDQALPVFKHIGFASGINISLGLPYIRTSVDHGTALNLAGSGKASFSSLNKAIKTASNMLQS